MDGEEKRKKAKAEAKASTSKSKSNLRAKQKKRNREGLQNAKWGRRDTGERENRFLLLPLILKFQRIHSLSSRSLAHSFFFENEGILRATVLMDRKLQDKHKLCMFKWMFNGVTNEIGCKWRERERETNTNIHSSVFEQRVWTPCRLPWTKHQSNTGNVR